MKSYEVLASFYDRFNEQIDYSEWADRIVSFFDAYGIKKDAIILDAACGTGKMTLELAGRGYDMIGTDLSAEMLMQARIAADEIEKIVGREYWCYPTYGDLMLGVR